MYLSNHLRALSPGCLMKVPHGRSLLIDPAIAQLNPYTVFTMPEQSGNIIREIKHPLTIIRKPRIECMIIDSLPVKGQPVIPQTAYIATGRSNLFGNIEHFTKHRRGFVVFIIPIGNPGSFPIRCRKFSGFKPHRFRNDLLIIQPHFYPPPVSGVRTQRTPGVRNQLLIRLLFAGIPDISLSLSQQFRSRRDQNPIGRLPTGHIRSVHFPHQTRALHIKS